MKRNFFSNRKNRMRRRGAAMVEAAFVVIILLSLSLGLIQWGVIFNASISVTNMSREGARYAAVHYNNKDDEEIVAYVKNNRPPNMAADDINVLISPNDTQTREKGEPIVVTVDYDMSKKLFLPSTIFPGTDYSVTFFSGRYVAKAQMMMEG